MEKNPTVYIEPVEAYANAVWLRWMAHVDEADIRHAFRHLTRLLNEAETRIHVLVDLRNNPGLPLQATISETLSGPFLHRNMGQWLVVGSNHRAQIIGTIISKVGRANSISWFSNEEDAMTFLEIHEQARIASGD